MSNLFTWFQTIYMDHPSFIVGKEELFVFAQP